MGGAPDTSTAAGNSVRVWVGGKGAGAGWREISGWPPAGPREQRWYLGPHGSLTAGGPADAGTPPARFRYDPADPTPSVGGATMTPSAGVRDNRALEARADVLVFTSEPLAGRWRSSARWPPNCPWPGTTRTPTCSCGCATSMRGAGRGTSAMGSSG